MLTRAYCDATQRYHWWCKDCQKSSTTQHRITPQHIEHINARHSWNARGAPFVRRGDATIDNEASVASLDRYDFGDGKIGDSILLTPQFYAHCWNVDTAKLRICAQENSWSDELGLRCTWLHLDCGPMYTNDNLSRLLAGECQQLWDAGTS